MRLKIYRAARMPEAMAQLREELGADAVILSTRRTAHGVEVVAALEPEEPLSDPPGQRRAFRNGDRAAGLSQPAGGACRLAPARAA